MPIHFQCATCDRWIHTKGDITTCEDCGAMFCSRCEHDCPIDKHDIIDAQEVTT